MKSHFRTVVSILLLTALLALTAFSQHNALDRIELVSSSFEPGTDDAADSTLDKLGVANLRFKINFLDSSHGVYPFSVQVNLDAITFPGRDGAVALVSTQASPFFEGASTSEDPPVAPQQYLLALVPNPPEGKSSTPTLMLKRGFFQSIRARERDDSASRWERQGYPHQGHFLTVSIPLQASLYNPVPSLPLGCTIVFSMLTRESDDHGVWITATRSFRHTIQPNPREQFPADVTIGESQSKWDLTGIHLLAVGRFENLAGFEQKYGHAVNLHLMNRVRLRVDRSHGRVYDNFDGVCTSDERCYPKQVERLDRARLDMKMTDMSHFVSLDLKNPSTALFSNSFYQWPGTQGDFLVPAYFQDYRYKTASYWDEDGNAVIEFDAWAQMDYFIANCSELVQRLVPSYIRTDVHAVIDNVRVKIFSRVEKPDTAHAVGNSWKSLSFDPEHDSFAEFLVFIVFVTWFIVFIAAIAVPIAGGIFLAYYCLFHNKTAPVAGVGVPAAGSPNGMGGVAGQQFDEFGRPLQVDQFGNPFPHQPQQQQQQPHQQQQQPQPQQFSQQMPVPVPAQGFTNHYQPQSQQFAQNLPQNVPQNVQNHPYNQNTNLIHGQPSSTRHQGSQYQSLVESEEYPVIGNINAAPITTTTTTTTTPTGRS